MITFELDSMGTSPIAGKEPKVISWIQAVAAMHGFSVGQVHYIFCTDEKILDVNKQFLQHDYYTDIITFDYSTAHTLNGDIFISLDTVLSNSQEQHTEFEEEILRIIIHGILHLTGQGDKTPETKNQMTAKENNALALLSQFHLA